MSLNKMYCWCTENQITLNSKKCKCVHFGDRRVINNDKVPKLGNTRLDRVKQYKYLETVIDEKLKGEAQYNNMTQILSTRKKTFSKIRYLIDEETVVLLYKTTIQPIFDYNYFFYKMLNQDNQDKLQTMQNRFLRMVYRNLLPARRSLRA